MSNIGKRLRFEILKRDGFRCHYCGASPTNALLHVDHVIPLAEGGDDHPENLLTSCADCNLGKSDIPLAESRLEPRVSPETIRERTEQVREYTAALAEYEEAKSATIGVICDAYRARVRCDPPQVLVGRFGGLLEEHGIERLQNAFSAVGAWRARTGAKSAVDEAKYLHGVLRKMKAER